MDRAKRGTKRSLLTEASGVPVGLAVAGANKNDFKMFAETLWSIPAQRPAPTLENPQHLCLDKGYDYEQVRALAQAFGFVAHIRSRGEETTEKAAGQKARRWPVERTHSWMKPLPQHPDPLDQESRQLRRPASLRLRSDRLPCRRIIRIGS